VIRPAKYGDQRGRLHEQRIEKPFLQFRLVPRELLTLAQLRIHLCRSPLVFHVGVGAKPMHHLPAGITHRVDACEKSPKRTVGASERKHHLEWGAHGD
jgi:hypothetical protein